jgi:thiol-disulfide isomerase/thioredoxin
MNPDDEHLSAEPLLIGAKVPAYTPEGWVIGPPKPYDAPGVKLTVLDIWSRWCPYCEMSAPGLYDVSIKYKDRGVQFVSLTSMPMEGAKHYAEMTRIDWPNGYMVPVQDLAALGAYRTGQRQPGFALAPTFYIVGSDGRVRWTDKRARMRHVPPKQLMADLDAALAAELAK